MREAREREAREARERGAYSVQRATGGSMMGSTCTRSAHAVHTQVHTQYTRVDMQRVVGQHGAARGAGTHPCSPSTFPTRRA